MRKLGFIFTAITCCLLASGADCAVRGAATTSRNQTSQASQRTTTGRSAVQPTVTGVRGRAAVVPTANKVVGRAATTQKVINTGTKIATATTNTTVNELCKTQYYGCMDSFCMLDNTSGGRCLCSDRNAELDSVLAEIQRLDEQSYAIATTGVERVEMGADADAVIAQANAVAQSFVTESKTSEKRRALDLANWNSVIDFDEDDMDSDVSLIDGKTGTALHDVVYDLCVDQIRQESPDCIKDLNMLKLMYAQQIRSDCTAYENSLKQQKTASAQKLFAAESALREAALEQYRAANKYDLGQCTIEFKKCMISTAGCGDDFSSCASVSAIDNTNTRYSKSKKGTYSIKGAVTTIDISKSTYDTLVAKKPLCETVTKSCVAVKDQVWDTFLKEVAPQLKSAELIAEDNARQNCIGSISSCFQKACKDNIDPNDPDGSYDMCLTRPDTMLNLCKVPLQACGIDVKKPESSDIWNFVVARLAAMRVDSCTTQVKECLQSDDRCGDDYTQCVGLDLDSIKNMCPPEKLVGCQKDGKLASFDDDWLNNLLQGIYLSIDDSMLDQCQQIVNEKMIEVCGDTATCYAFDADDMLGTESLRSSKDSNGNFVISGLVSFGNVQVNKVDNLDETGNKKVSGIEFGQYSIDVDNYLDQVTGSDTAKLLAKSSLETVSSKINQTIALLSQDPKVQMCVNGRDMSQIRGSARAGERDVARYPNLLDSAMLTIINSGLDKARMNHTTKYNQLVANAVEESDDQVKQALCASMATSDEPVCTRYDSSIPVCKEYTPTADYLNSLFSGVANDPYAVEYIISGANMSKLMNIASRGSQDYTLTNENGAMIGKLVMSSVYSASDNTCTITTSSTMCDETEVIYDTKRCAGGFSLLGGVGNGCGSGSGGIFAIKGATTITTAKGTVCKTFKDTETTVQTVKM